MQKRKKSTIDALTTFIQNNDLSYTEIGDIIGKNIKNLDIPSPWDNFTYIDKERRVSRLANGNKPSFEELQALALWRFNDPNKWRYLYFPDDQEAYNFTLRTYQSELNKILDSKDKVIQKLSSFTKSNIRNGIDYARVTSFNLTCVIIGLLNFNIQDKVSLGRNLTKIDLYQYVASWPQNNIKVDSPLVKKLAVDLRNVLDLDHSKKREQKQIALRAIISVL